jgi:L-threonylcarbamoyladenylate synthase
MYIVQIDLNKNYDDVLLQAVAILRQGGSIVYPTDTVYGIGCNATDEFAVRHIYDIKQRSPKPLPVLVKNMAWAEEVVYLNESQRKICNKFWPGKFTLIFPKKDIIPDIVTTGLPSVGVRIADHVFTDKLLGAYGYPLVGTSANLSGGEATGDINKIIKEFKDMPRRPDLVIDAGVLPPSNPSVLIDCTSDKPKVLRVGPSKPEDLLKLLEI